MGLFNLTTFQLIEIKERITRLEEKTFGKKKPPITVNQQILAFNELGLLDIIRTLEIPNVKKAELLSIILKTDFSNTKKGIEALANKDSTLVKNVFNYQYLSDLFDNVDLGEKSVQMQSKIRKLEENEVKKNK